MTETIKIGKGFEYRQKTDTVNFQTAYTILSTSKQFRFSEATANFEHNTVDFKKDFFVCPMCSYRIDAYKRRSKEYGFTPKAVTSKEAYDWCFSTSFFDETYKTLTLYKPLLSQDEILCPNCNHSAPIADGYDEYIANYRRHKITVSTRLTRISDILNTEWADNLTFTDLPLTETVIFNFKKGRISLSLTSNGKVLCIRDITLIDHNITSKMISAINSNTSLKTYLRHRFQHEWKTALPFKTGELNFKIFCLMTQYIGFTGDFYSNIPHCYNRNDNWVFDTSFSVKAKKLHKYEYTPAIFEKSFLPKTKALKKYMLDNPQCFFYIEEIEKLYAVFGDINNLLTFLKKDTAFLRLSFMHNYEKVYKFYADFAEVKGKNSLSRYLIKKHEKFNNYGIIYLSLGDKFRKQAKTEWRGGKNNFLDRIKSCLIVFEPSTSAVSVYYDNNIEFIKMHTDGFVFTLLKTKNDYVYYGTRLANCLAEISESGPVVCMSKNGTAVAAIEIDTYDMTIKQALLKNNAPIETDPKAFSAFKKWCMANKLDYQYDTEV